MFRESTKSMTINHNKIFILLSILPFTVLLKFLQFGILPDKYFADSNQILNIMRNGNLHFAQAESFNNSALLFNTINIFNFSSLLQWSLFISILADMYLFVFLYNKKIYNFRQIISLYCILGLLIIFVFNLSKDIIQFTIFAMISAIIGSSQIKQVKIAFVSLILFAESIFYRPYYVLIALFFISISVIMPFINAKAKRRKSDLKKITILIKLVLIVCISLIILLNVSSIILPEEYKELITIRNRLNAGRVGESNAQTVIVNLINDNGNHLLFTVNYFINAVRMMLPFELLPKGLFYLPFFIFQILCTLSLLRCIINFNMMNEKNKLMLYVMCSYYLVAFLFEPDFGSFVRHEAATFAVLYFVMIDTVNEKVVYAQ